MCGKILNRFPSEERFSTTFGFHFNFFKVLIRSVQLKQYKPSTFSTRPELPNL